MNQTAESLKQEYTAFKSFCGSENIKNHLLEDWIQDIQQKKRLTQFSCLLFLYVTVSLWNKGFALALGQGTKMSKTVCSVLETWEPQEKTNTQYPESDTPSKWNKEAKTDYLGLRKGSSEEAAS